MNKFLKKFTPYGFKAEALTPVYGMAEATLAITFSDYKKQIQFKKFDQSLLANSIVKESEDGVNFCSVGRPVKEMEVFIQSKEGKILGHGEVGEVLVKGPSLTPGYYNDEEKTKATIKKGILHTGDRGFIYKDELYICGRIKDTIIIRGKNYYPTTFEEKIYSIPGMREGRVVVSSQFCKKENTEQLVVLAELKSKSLFKKKAQVYKEIIQKKIHEIGFKSDLIRVLPPGTLPKTTSGKLQRKRAVSLYANNVVMN